MTPSLLPAADAAVLEQLHGCEQIDLLLPDMNGLLRGKRITRDALEKVYQNGVCLPMSLIATDITGNTVEETGLGYDIGDEDRICRPVPGSLRPESGAVVSADDRRVVFRLEGNPGESVRVRLEAR